MMFRLIPEVMNGTHGRFKPVRMGHFRELQFRSRSFRTRYALSSRVDKLLKKT
jgi:hypothetical protein